MLIAEVGMINRFVSQYVTEICKGSLNSSITPATILLSHAYDKGSNFLYRSGSARCSEGAAIVLLRNQPRCQANSVSGVTIVAATYRKGGGKCLLVPGMSSEEDIFAANWRQFGQLTEPTGGPSFGTPKSPNEQSPG